MAIYHLTASTGSRKNGQSAAAKIDYIQRSGRYTRDPAECLHAESGNMPGFAQEAADYWSAADTYERANGRLFKQVEFALPVELSLDAQRELARDFAQELAGEKLPYSLAIHAGKGTNPHCHLMISERVNDGVDRPREQWFRRHNSKKPDQGGAKKTAALKPKQWLIDTRERWAELANQALEKANQPDRIDHRTLEAQGIERVPGVHLGPNVAAMAERGISTDRADMAAEIEAANQRIGVLLEQRDELDQTIDPLMDKIIRSMEDKAIKNQPTLDSQIAASFEKYQLEQERKMLREKAAHRPEWMLKTREVTTESGVKWTQYKVSDATLRNVKYDGPTPLDDQIYERLSQGKKLSEHQNSRFENVARALQNHELDTQSGLHLPKNFREQMGEREDKLITKFVGQTYGRVTEPELDKDYKAVHVGTILTHSKAHHAMRDTSNKKIILLNDADVKTPTPGKTHLIRRRRDLEGRTQTMVFPIKDRNRDGPGRGWER